MSFQLYKMRICASLQPFNTVNMALNEKSGSFEVL